MFHQKKNVCSNNYRSRACALNFKFIEDFRCLIKLSIVVQCMVKYARVSLFCLFYVFFSLISFFFLPLLLSLSSAVLCMYKYSDVHSIRNFECHRMSCTHANNYKRTVSNADDQNYILFFPSRWCCLCGVALHCIMQLVSFIGLFGAQRQMTTATAPYCNDQRHHNKTRKKKQHKQHTPYQLTNSENGLLHVYMSYYIVSMSYFFYCDSQIIKINIGKRNKTKKKKNMNESMNISNKNFCSQQINSLVEFL